MQVRNGPRVVLSIVSGSATTVFRDPLANPFPDTDHSMSEQHLSGLDFQRGFAARDSYPVSLFTGHGDIPMSPLGPWPLVP
jgi:hypothetical protein